MDVPTGARAEQAAGLAATSAQPVLSLQGVTVAYSGAPAIADVDLDVRPHEVLAFIGPSGCGKSTLLRSLNRMNDPIKGAEVTGHIAYHGVDLYGPGISATEVRRRVGMVFQKPNPFPGSVYDNVAFGPRLHARRDDLDDVVERSLRRAALWDEVEAKLRAPASSLSGGQQQRLCIARALAVEPDVLLMDEPASALDPVATAKIEDLMRELTELCTIVVVTHNMQQAARVSDRTAFFTTEVDDRDRRCGRLVELAATEALFASPSDSRTEDYITGRFG